MAKKQNGFKKFLASTKAFFVSLYDGWRANVMFSVGLFTVLLTLTLSALLSGKAEIAVYVLFVFCILFLIYFLSFLIYHREKIKTLIIDTANKYEITRNLLEMYGFKILLLELVTFVVNLAYAFFLSIISIRNRSFWYGSLAIFHFLLMFIRLVLLINQHGSAKRYSILKLWTEYEVEDAAERAGKKSKRQELRVYRLCGILMLFLTIALSVAIIQRVVSGGSAKYSGLMIYMTALYTFYKIIISCIRYVKNRKHHNHYIQCFENINIIDAAVSVFSLQAALLRQFGGGFDYFVPNAVLGIAVGVLIIAIGITMIIKGTLALNKLNKPIDKESINEK